MQAGSAVQDELIDFISASRRDDLAKLLRYAGELLPPGGGGDGIAAHRSVLMGYLTRAPGHLVLAQAARCGLQSGMHASGDTSSLQFSYFLS